MGKDIIEVETRPMEPKKELDDLVSTSTPKYVPLETLLYYRDEKKLSLREIGKMVGITYQAVSERFRKEGISSNGKISHLKNKLGFMLRLRISEILNSLTPAEIKRIPPAQRGILACAFIDKVVDKGEKTGLTDTGYAEMIAASERPESEDKDNED